MSDNLPGQIRRSLEREEKEARTRKSALVQGELEPILDKVTEALRQSRTLLACADKLLSRR
jgi:molecular chaperone GrpE (heat shock protein)